MRFGWGMWGEREVGQVWMGNVGWEGCGTEVCVGNVGWEGHEAEKSSKIAEKDPAHWGRGARERGKWLFLGWFWHHSVCDTEEGAVGRGWQEQRDRDSPGSEAGAQGQPWELGQGQPWELLSCISVISEVQHRGVGGEGEMSESIHALCSSSPERWGRQGKDKGENL